MAENDSREGKKMEYRFMEGADRMEPEEVVQLLRTTYWAENRPRETIEKSMGNSACFGIRSGETGRLVAFARVITDYATTYYLCDVVVDPAVRGRGLGKALVGHIEALPELSGLRGFLITRDAHGLYRKFGYEVVNDRVMVKQNK
jgi:ribosomal protein S18 acetylase RimI-like enzyme